MANIGRPPDPRQVMRRWLLVGYAAVAGAIFLFAYAGYRAIAERNAGRVLHGGEITFVAACVGVLVVLLKARAGLVDFREDLLSRPPRLADLNLLAGLIDGVEQDPSREANRRLEAAVAQILGLHGPESLAVLSDKNARRLYSRISSRTAQPASAFLLALVDALRHHQDLRALPYVRARARSLRRSGELTGPLAASIEDCLHLLNARAAGERTADALLRPSARGREDGPWLLRARYPAEDEAAEHVSGDEQAGAGRLKRGSDPGR